MMENFSYAEPRNISFKELENQILLNRRKKVMVIDDDQDFRLAVSEILVDEGYTVMTAKDGEVGLNNLIHQRDLPDLILVDVLMPIKSGLEFRREQLKLEGISGIPVIFVTGQGYIDGESVLLKPFDQREFLDAIREHINHNN